MLHVGELAKILAFLGDQREKLVASDALFAGVLKRDGDANEMSGTGGGGTLYLSHPVYPCTSFDEEKKQLAARRDRERQLKERRAKLEAQGITNRTEDEIEAMEMEGERGGSKSSTQILGGGNDSKNPTMKVITFPELKKDAVGGGGQKSSTAAGGAAFIKEKPPAAAGAGKAASGLAGLKSNNVAIKIFSNEGTPCTVASPRHHLLSSYCVCLANCSAGECFWGCTTRSAAGAARAQHGHGGPGRGGVRQGPPERQHDPEHLRLKYRIAGQGGLLSSHRRGSCHSSLLLRRRHALLSR
jgi:hypothetical protein